MCMRNFEGKKRVEIRFETTSTDNKAQLTSSDSIYIYIYIYIYMCVCMCVYTGTHSHWMLGVLTPVIEFCS